VSIVPIYGKALAVKRGVERTVTIEKVDVALRISRQSCSRHPNSPFVAVRRDVQHGCLCQGQDVVAHQPASVGAKVAMRGERDIDDPPSSSRPARSANCPGAKMTM